MKMRSVNVASIGSELLVLLSLGGAAHLGVHVTASLGPVQMLSTLAIDDDEATEDVRGLHSAYGRCDQANVHAVVGTAELADRVMDVVAEQLTTGNDVELHIISAWKTVTASPQRGLGHLGALVPRDRAAEWAERGLVVHFVDGNFTNRCIASFPVGDMLFNEDADA